MLGILAVVWIVALYVDDPVWRWSIAGIGTVVCLVFPGGLSCLRWLLSPRFRRQWREYRRGGSPPGGPARGKPIRIPRKQFHAWANGAMLVMREFSDLSIEAKARLKRTDQPIESADVEELIGKLSQMQRKIDNQIEREISDSKDTADTEWDQAAHEISVVPTLQTANSSKTIVNSVLFAVNHGARKAELIYKLMIAEMDAAVARWYVAMNAGLQTMGPMTTALLATTGMTPQEQERILAK
jgi:hypothetical protein